MKFLVILMFLTISVFGMDIFLRNLNSCTKKVKAIISRKNENGQATLITAIQNWEWQKVRKITDTLKTLEQDKAIKILMTDKQNAFSEAIDSILKSVNQFGYEPQNLARKRIQIGTDMIYRVYWVVKNHENFSTFVQDGLTELQNQYFILKFEADDLRWKICKQEDMKMLRELVLKRSDLEMEDSVKEKKQIKKVYQLYHNVESIRDYVDEIEEMKQLVPEMKEFLKISKQMKILKIVLDMCQRAQQRNLETLRNRIQ